MKRIRIEKCPNCGELPLKLAVLDEDRKSIEGYQLQCGSCNLASMLADSKEIAIVDWNGVCRHIEEKMAKEAELDDNCDSM